MPPPTQRPNRGPEIRERNTATSGRPTRRKQTRTKILDAARDEISRSGIAGATLRSIARRARVNPALLHYYFGSKTDLLVALVEEAYAELEEKVQKAIRAADDSAEQRLRSLIDALAELASQPHVAEILVHAVLVDTGSAREQFVTSIAKPLSDIIQTLIGQGIDAGEFQPPRNPLPPPLRTLVPSLLCLALSLPFTARRTIRRSDAADAQAWAQAVGALICHGLRGS